MSFWPSVTTFTKWRALSEGEDRDYRHLAELKELQSVAWPPLGDGSAPLPAMARALSIV
jgi:hypothetical protein